MELEKIAAVIRPRTPWEAIDLGFVMVRRWWRRIYAAWLPTAGLVHAAVWAMALPRHPFLGLALLLLLEPALDRVPLHTVSRALFGEAASPWSVIKRLPFFLFEDPWGLALARFDPRRSVLQPIGDLEGLRGRARRERRRVVVREVDGAAVLHAFASVVLELAMALSLIALSFLVAPDMPDWNVERFGRSFFDAQVPLRSELVVAVAWSISFLALEPFFVVGGFALYLNRRAHLEGWDIELAFRKLALRLARVAALFFALVLSAHASGTSYADDDPVRARAEQIVSGPEFGGRETKKVWRFREDRIEWLKGCLSSEDKSPMIVPGFVPVLFEVLLGALLFSLGAYLVTRWVRSRDPRGAPPEEDSGRPGATVMGALEAARAPPDDIVAEARRLFAAGERAAALGLLYGQAVTALVERGVPIESGDTEGQCLRRVRLREDTGTVSAFADLTAVWQAVAYAHRTVDRSHFEALCAAWPDAFLRAQEAT